MRALILPLLLTCLATPSPAQSLLEAARGLYGSASDPATSCAANPHELGFILSPPHLVLTWKSPIDAAIGGTRAREVYDLEGTGAASILLREEAPYRSTEGGIWEMLLTRNPIGYCWRRPDWPAVRCEDQQLRCDSATS